MNCTDILPLLSGHLDQMNTAQEEALLKKHLEQCKDCQQLLAQMKKNDALLAASCEEPPKDLTERIMKQVRNEKAAKLKKNRVGSWLSSGVAAAALLGFAVFGGYLSPDNAATTESAAAPEAPAQLYDAEWEKVEAAEGVEADMYYYFIPEESYDAVQETSAELPGLDNSLSPNSSTKKSTPVEKKFADYQLPFLMLWEADPADFEILENHDPDNDVDLRDRVISALSEETVSGRAPVYTIITYTVSRDVMLEVYGQCKGLYELYLAPLDQFSRNETCKIIFVQTDDSIPLMPQS